MKNTIILAAVVATVILPGCVTTHPQNASEFRAAVPSGFMTGVETYEVSQPYEKVSERFKKMAPKCLNASVKTTTNTNRSSSMVVTDYKPTVIAGKNRTELHVQQHYSKGVKTVSNEPEGGYYLMVVDATKVGTQKTRIDYYGPTSGYDTMVKAIKGWASGENVGCPDLTK